ncbi:hypothetical protein CB1_000286012 [Camelus ferus]|nr:hypothetical protein CB1_000286012 [Camelus ferus]
MSYWGGCVWTVRQEALLAAISEKDANIALLELSSSKKKTQEEVAALKREKDRLVQQLKQQGDVNWGGELNLCRGTGQSDECHTRDSKTDDSAKPLPLVRFSSAAVWVYAQRTLHFLQCLLCTASAADCAVCVCVTSIWGSD